ncbi:hypothetical protein GCM10020219_061280 [Nonomuraea dietziae]
MGDDDIASGHHAEKAGTPPLEQTHSAGGANEQEGSGQEDDGQDGHPPRTSRDRADNAWEEGGHQAHRKDLHLAADLIARLLAR